MNELAAAVGLSQTGLLHYFGSKENLFMEVLRWRDLADRAFASQADRVANMRNFGTTLGDIVLRNSQVPGFVQLSTSVTVDAVGADYDSHDYFKNRYTQITKTLRRHRSGAPAEKRPAAAASTRTRLA